MTWIEVVGHSGAFLSSVTLVPQVYKAWQSRSVGDLSLSMMFIVVSSTIVWLIYGINLNLLPVIICNGILCAMSLTLIYFKFSFKK